MRISRYLAAALWVLLALPVTATRADGPPVWSVHGNRNTVYLFGSVHLLRPGEFALQAALEDAYEDAEAVVMEVDMDDLTPLDVAAATVARADASGVASARQWWGASARGLAAGCGSPARDLRQCRGPRHRTGGRLAFARRAWAMGRSLPSRLFADCALV